MGKMLSGERSAGSPGLHGACPLAPPRFRSSNQGAEPPVVGQPMGLLLKEVFYRYEDVSVRIRDARRP